MLHLIPGKAKPGEGDDDENTEGMSFKKKKALKEKASAGSSHNWNTLFLGASAVADVVAKTYDVEKSDVLLEGDKKSKQSAAVRLALGETQLVAETRNFLEEQGVSLDAFEGSSKGGARSKTTILVKNLPAGVAPEKIRDLFAAHGELGRVVLPPGCITALVEFQEPSEARRGFKALAYTRFQNTPLYLEWAPEKALSPREFVKKEEKEEKPSTKEEEEEDTPPEPDTTLFVKNLNFETTEDSLKEHFSSAGRVHSATISRKRSAGEMLSMGYGFVQFKAKASAEKALKELQHRQLDSHCLELKRSNRATAEESSGGQKRKSTNATDKGAECAKIMVRNVPFQADPSEVEQVFKAFGDLKSVRLPRKMGQGGHRGFGFIEFASKSDARRAMDSLRHSTHLYGRRLVLEWAEAEDTIETLQKKTASKFASSSGGGAEGGPPSAKRVKKAKLMEDVIVRGKE